MKIKIFSLICICLLLQACNRYIDPNTSVDRVLGTVGGAFSHITLTPK